MGRAGILLTAIMILGCMQYVAFAQDLANDELSSLTDEQKKEYNQSKLSVEVEGVVIGSYGSGLWSGSSWRRWTAYKGFDRLSEERFFRVTGYDAEAEKARSYNASNSGMTAIGAILTVGGTIAALVGASKTKTTHYDYGYGINGDLEESDPDAGLVYGGLIAAGIGSGLMYAGILGLSRNWAPYAVVEGITNEYNQKIIIGMKKDL
jgi:hypothetical protein